MGKEQEQTVLQNNINRICQGTEIVGNVMTPGDIRIDGVLKGNINAQGRIVIGATGFIKGEITCRNVDIWGAFEGKLVVSEALFLKSTGVVTGDIVTAKLIVEPNAIYNGACSMPKNEPKLSEKEKLEKEKQEKEKKVIEPEVKIK